MTVEIVNVQSAAAPDEAAAAAALAEAAKTAPTTEAEARAQIEAAAAAKVEAPKTDAERPEWLDPKFADAEAMAKAYKELEAKLGAPKEEPKVEEPKPEGAEPKVEEAPKKASEVVASLNERFEANGTLDDTDYEAAEAIGHDRATVDAFIAGQKALAEVATQRITEAAGGKDSMDRMFAWASTALPAADVDTFNGSFQGSDVNAAVIAMEQLKTKYETANGKEPTLIGGKPNGSGSDVFTSWAEIQAAMSDPRYKKDHAYRTQIENKVGRSDNIR